MDPDYILVSEIGYAVKELGYMQPGDLWYTFENENWLVVRTFKIDKDAISMINRSQVEKRSVLNIYMDHTVDEVELVDDVEPPLTLDDVGPSHRGCDFEEDICEKNR